ncbi:hypothetical protein J6590_069901 [Homalodisca vitripennis]|nr:hypothetical protein J6590_069901 [Homalodisca vitripennis]
MGQKRSVDESGDICAARSGAASRPRIRHDAISAAQTHDQCCVADNKSCYTNWQYKLRVIL